MKMVKRIIDWCIIDIMQVISKEPLMTPRTYSHVIYITQRLHCLCCDVGSTTMHGYRSAIVRTTSLHPRPILLIYPRLIPLM